MHEVLVNRLGGLSLPRKSVVRLTDRPYVTLDVYRGHKTTIQQQRYILSLHISFNFVRAAVAFVILERISGFQPSSEMIARRYFKLVTVSNFCPLTMISVWLPLELFVFSLVFSALITIFYLVQVLWRLSTRASISYSFSARAFRSSANHG